MSTRSYTPTEDRIGRARTEKMLFTAILLAQLMFCYASASWTLLAISLAVMGAAWYFAHRHREFYVSRIFINVAVLVLGLALVARYMSTDEPLLIVLGRYVMLIQVCKIFERKGNRDYVQIIIMSMLLVLASAMLAQELLFAVMLMGYLVAMPRAAIALTIKRSLETAERNATPKTPAETWPGGPITTRLAVVVIGMLATGTATFLVMPRSFGARAGTVATRSHEATSGFGDPPRLGQKLDIYLSNRLVMEMRMVDPTTGEAVDPSGPPYLRGRSFDQYYNSQWTRGSRNRLDLAGEAERQAEDLCLRQEVSMDPSLLPVIFASYPALKVECRDSGVTRFYDREYEVKRRRRFNRPVRYTAWVLSDSSEMAARLADRTTEPKPGALIDPSESAPDVPMDVVNLARKWCADLTERRKDLAPGPMRDAVNLEIARRLVTRLGENYEYTLDLTDANPRRDGVEDFLFYLKKGHCEYFASAMTVMCQTLGVRARYTTGFAGGQYDASSKSFTIRERDAHAWTEVYTPSTGWRVFDATPAARFQPPPAGVPARVYSWLRDTWQEWEFAWFAQIVGYDDNDRQALASYFQQRISGVVDWIKQTAREIWHGLIELFAKGRIDPALRRFALVVAGVALAIACLLYLRRFRLPRKTRKPGVPAAPKPPAFMAQLLKLLARHGAERMPAQTTRQWASQAVEKLRLPADEVRWLVDLHERLRWAGRRADKAQLAEADNRVRRLRDFLST